MNGKFINLNSEKLNLGCGFLTYLFFNIPPTAFLGNFKKAEIVLFKLPAETRENHCTPDCDRYCACPLLDYFNVFGSCFAPPRMDECLCVDFCDREPLGYTQIDITKIAEAWLKSELENKGLILNGAPNTRQIVYASNRFEAPGMHPMLRLTYKNADFPLSVAPCIVDVK